VVTATADEQRVMAACCVIGTTRSAWYGMTFDRVASRRLN